MNREFYDSLSKEGKIRYLWNEYKNGKTPYDLRKYGIPNTTLVRQYRNYCKYYGLDYNYSEHRKKVNYKIIDGEEFVSVKIPGYEKYLVSKTGKVYSLRNNVLFEPRFDDDGYLSVGLKSTVDNKRHTIGVHKLVLYTFKGPPPENMIDPSVDHINGIKTENRIENLRWLSRSDNGSRIYKHVDRRKIISNRTLSDEDVISICNMLNKNMDICKIAELNNTSVDIVKRIKNGETYTEITKMHNIKPKDFKLSYDIYDIFFDMYFSNKNTKEIKETMKITKSSLYKELVNNIYDFENSVEFDSSDLDDSNENLINFTSFK